MHPRPLQQPRAGAHAPMHPRPLWQPRACTHAPTTAVPTTCRGVVDVCWPACMFVCSYVCLRVCSPLQHRPRPLAGTILVRCSVLVDRHVLAAPSPVCRWLAVPTTMHRCLPACTCPSASINVCARAHVHHATHRPLQDTTAWRSALCVVRPRGPRCRRSRRALSHASRRHVRRHALFNQPPLRESLLCAALALSPPCMHRGCSASPWLYMPHLPVRRCPLPLPAKEFGILR